MNKLPPWVIWHIPHASTEIPAEFRDQFLLNDEELQAEAKLVADTGADELYLEPENLAIVFPLSRLVVDPERLRGDAEPMEKHGLGMIYRKTHDGRPLRRELLSAEEQALVNIYEDHHARLTERVKAILEQHGRCLILDGHSYPADPLPFEDSTLDRLPVCLGADPIHSPYWLVGAFVEAFTAHGIEIGINTPYAGTLVPERHQYDGRVMSVMIETRKDCYSEQVRKAVERAVALAGRHNLMPRSQSIIFRNRPVLDLDNLPPIPQDERDRRLRAALRLKERRQNHPWYGKRAAECRARGGEEAEMEYWLNLHGTAVLSD